MLKGNKLMTASINIYSYPINQSNKFLLDKTGDLTSQGPE